MVQAKVTGHGLPTMFDSALYVRVSPARDPNIETMASYTT